MPRSPCSRRTLRPSLATAVAVMRVLLKLPAAIGDTVEHTQRRWLNPGRCRNALRIIYHNPNPVAPLSKSDPDSLLHFAWCIFIDAADPPTMFKCSTVLLIAIFVAVNAQYDASESSFESWRAKYQVVYKSVDEATHRYGVWIANLRRVASHNAREEAGLETYRMAMNIHADLTNAEYRAFRLRPRENVERQGGLIATPSSPVVNNSATTNNASIDWVKQGVVTPVKDQGQCGANLSSCPLVSPPLTVNPSPCQVRAGPSVLSPRWRAPTTSRTLRAASIAPAPPNVDRIT